MRYNRFIENKNIKMIKLIFGSLAQLAEQQTLNLWVVGSNPTRSIVEKIAFEIIQCNSAYYFE